MVKMGNLLNIIIILMEDLTILLIIRYMTRVLEFGQKQNIIVLVVTLE